MLCLCQTVVNSITEIVFKAKELTHFKENYHIYRKDITAVQADNTHHIPQF